MTEEKARKIIANILRYSEQRSEELLVEEIEEIVAYHKELHGKNIVKYAIVDDVIRKVQGIGYDDNRAVLEHVVEKVLDNING